MAFNFVSYKLQPHDTIDGIAKQLGKKTQEIIWEHNRFASRHEWIKDNQIENIEKIWIQYDDENIEKFPFLKVCLQKSKIDLTNLFQPQYYNHEYTVDVNKFTDEDEDENIKMQYNIYLQYQFQAENNFVVNVSRSNFLVNQATPKQKMDVLAIHCTNVLFPFQIVINKFGTIHKINNCSEILERWINTKKILLEEYTDEYSIKYISAMDDIYTNPEYLNEMLLRQLFLQLLIKPIAMENVGNSSISYFFSIIPHTTPIHFNIEQSLYDNEEKNILQLEQNGTAIDKRSVEDIVTHNNIIDEVDFSDENYSPINAEYVSDIVLDKQTGVLVHLTSRFKVDFPYGQEITEINISQN
jgi:hypothetical protein